jgi:cobalt-zinc-cadmium efflux system outer membrane protein
MIRKIAVSTVAVACLLARASSAQPRAQDPPPAATAPPSTCAALLSAEVVVRCALGVSPEVAELRARLDATEGRRETARTWLPSNPVLGGWLAHRTRPEDGVTALNWNVSLAQELEVGGQRGLKAAQADEERTAASRRLRAAEEEVAAGALSAFYEAVAARESTRLARDLGETARVLAALAEARAKEELVAGVEADVARAEATRVRVVGFEAERRSSEATAALALLLGVGARELVVPDELAAPGVIDVPSGSLEQEAVARRGEVAAAEAERRVLERRLALVRRERLPNPTVSVFAERGEINDRIWGGGLSIPLPLPAPVGRSRAGEIAEALAQVHAAESTAEQVRRRVRREVAAALAAFTASNHEAELFAPDLIGRARADLSALREALAARRLTLREGLLWQRSLIELLQGDVEARRARLVAWVELRRAAGLGFVSGGGGR